jgi:hypothetical protein
MALLLRNRTPAKTSRVESMPCNLSSENEPDSRGLVPPSTPRRRAKRRLSHVYAWIGSRAYESTFLLEHCRSINILHFSKVIKHAIALSMVIKHAIALSMDQPSRCTPVITCDP